MPVCFWSMDFNFLWNVSRPQKSLQLITIWKHQERVVNLGSNTGTDLKSTLVDNYPLTLETHQNYFLEIKAGCPPMSLKTHLRPFNQTVLSFQSCVLSLFLVLTMKGSFYLFVFLTVFQECQKVHASFSGCLTRNTYLLSHAVIWACLEFTMQPSWATNSWSFCPSTTIPITFHLSLESFLPATHRNNPVTCIYSQAHFTLLPVPLQIAETQQPLACTPIVNTFITALTQ